MSVTEVVEGLGRVTMVGGPVQQPPELLGDAVPGVEHLLEPQLGAREKLRALEEAQRGARLQVSLLQVRELARQCCVPVPAQDGQS